MAAAPTVYDDVADGAQLTGQLFAGKKFFVTQRCPTRTTYLDRIRSNGGTIVNLEKKADYLIADHLRKDAPAGSVSFQFIDRCIADGELVDPGLFPAGPSAASPREAGSSRPTKGGRVPFSAQDDRVLYKWVHDYEKQGGAVAGNAIYKQLEAVNARHTWQSWRDRYVKQLRDRPPPAFDIPDNAPPSPPTDQSVDAAPPAPPAPPAPRAPATKTPKKHVPRPDAEAGSTSGDGEHTVAELSSHFTVEDWEELYANCEHIRSVNIDQYLDGWQQWAQDTTQTSEQWRQYFEKVVRPQWDRDPQEKRDLLKQRVKHRHEHDGTQQVVDAVVDEPSTPPNATAPRQQRPEQATPRQPGSATTTDMQPPDEGALLDKMMMERKGKKALAAHNFWFRKQKRKVMESEPGLTFGAFPKDSSLSELTESEDELEERLKPQWDALSEQNKAPYYAMEAADRKRYEAENVAPVVSSSTVQHATPEYLAEAYKKTTKRVRELEETLGMPHEESSRPTPSKRRHINLSTSPETQQGTYDVIGTWKQPLEVSPVVSSSIEEADDQEDDAEDDQMENVVREELPDDSSVISADIEAFSNPAQQRQARPAKNLLSSSPMPSNSPTPRAPRQRQSYFHTQAILSSPSQHVPLAPLQKPQGFTQALRELDSDASSQSISGSEDHQPRKPKQNHEDDEKGSTTSSVLNLAPIHPPRESSEAPSIASSASSAASEDPDPPLARHELRDFFTTQVELGFSHEEIMAALKDTRLRPHLAISVLQAWEKGELLPNVRGVWSAQDDRDLTSGDAEVLTRLQEKHGWDGWGGFLEREQFLKELADANLL